MRKAGMSRWRQLYSAGKLSSNAVKSLKGSGIMQPAYTFSKAVGARPSLPQLATRGFLPVGRELEPTLGSVGRHVLGSRLGPLSSAAKPMVSGGAVALIALLLLFRAGASDEVKEKAQSGNTYNNYHYYDQRKM